MKLFYVVLLLLSSIASAQVSNTLSASIGAAKLGNPTLFNLVSARLETIKKACLQANQLQKSKQIDDSAKERLNLEINKALDIEIARINKSIPLDNNCIGKLMPLDLTSYAKNEGIDYLKSVKADVKASNYLACASKLEALLEEARDEN